MQSTTRIRGWSLRVTAVLGMLATFFLAGSCQRSGDVQLGPLTYDEGSIAAPGAEDGTAVLGRHPPLEDVLTRLGSKWETVRILGPLAATVVEEVIASCKSDPNLYVILLFDDTSPGGLGTAPYAAIESAYELLVASGLRQQVLTLDATGVSRSEPYVALVRRLEDSRPPGVPLGVERVLHDFLTAWARRDASGVRFLSPRIRSVYSAEALDDVLVGTSNPHHSSFLVNTMVSTGTGAWRASVSLFEHYTGYTLDLNPLSNECWLDVVCDGIEYFVDSPFIVAEAHWLLANAGAAWDIGRIRTRCWDVWRDELTLSLGGVVRYRTASYVLLPPKFIDVTGDGLTEVLVEGGEGGNYAGSGMLLILQLTGTSAIQLWPQPGGAGMKSDSASVRELDGAGPPELVGGDFRAAYWGPFGRLSTASQVSVPAIYRWNGSRYVHASAEFPEVYEERRGAIERTRRQEVAEWVKRDGFDGAVRALALLAERALISEKLGESERGWARVAALAADWRLARLWDAVRGEDWDESLESVLERFYDEILSTSREP